MTYNLVKSPSKALLVILLVSSTLLLSVWVQTVNAKPKPCRKRVDPNWRLYVYCVDPPGTECRLEFKDKEGNTLVLDGTCRNITGREGWVGWKDCKCKNTKQKGIREDAGRTRWQLESGSLVPVPGDQFSFRLDSLASDTELHWYNMHTVFDAEGRPIDNFEAISASDLSGSIFMEWGAISNPQAIEVKIISFDYHLNTAEFGWVDFILTSADAFAAYNSSSGVLTMLEPYEDALTCRWMEMNGGTFSSCATFHANISDSQMDMLQSSVSLVSPLPVGGVWVPVDKLGLLAPYIGLASTIAVATVATAIYIKRVKRGKEKR